MAYAVVDVGREKQGRGKNVCHGTAKETTGLGCRGTQQSKQLTDKRATSLSIPWEAPKVDGAKRKSQKTDRIAMRMRRVKARAASRETKVQDSRRAPQFWSFAALLSIRDAQLPATPLLVPTQPGIDGWQRANKQLVAAAQEPPFPVLASFIRGRQSQQHRLTVSRDPSRRLGINRGIQLKRFRLCFSQWISVM